MNLKYFFLFFLIYSCYNIERDCKNHKLGKYETEVTDKNGKKFKSIINRFDSIQIDIFDGKVDSFSVRRTSDCCEMFLKQINPRSMIEKKEMHLKILSTYKNTYKFEWGYVGDRNKIKGLAKKIN